MEATPQSGTVLADRYRLVRPLAQGGMGSVWRAEHIALDSDVAVKIIDPRIASREMGVPRFLREARALAALRSPHIVQVIDFGSDGGIVYLVMELLEGRTLGQRLKADGKLSAAETTRILGEVCRAMSHAHARGIVHRDLKPDNIFLCDHSREHVTKVVDFGIAKAMGDMASSTGTEVGAFLGTPSYMSPEQCRGSKGIDQRSDVWSLGAIAYECLVGKRLFEGDVIGDLAVRICTEALPIAATADQLPAGFDAWLRKAMAHSPDERFQSATELSRTLAAVLDVVADSQRGVDSADTLQADSAPLSLPVQAAGTISTLESSSLAKPAAQSRLSQRAPFRLALAAAAVIALMAVVALIRNQALPPPIEQADAARKAGPTPPPGSPGHTTPPSTTPGLPSQLAPPAMPAPGQRHEGTPDAGGLPVEDPQQRLPRAGHVKQSGASRPRPAPAQPSKQPRATREDALELEMLRKKR